MRELRVEDALLYLDQVKMEFGDRPQIYNEFLDIMKTFKTQQIDTPGVIRRVSTLFKGNKKLVLGFNTFLPEGYKIEIPADGDGPPVAVYRAPGQPGVTHILGPAAEAAAAPSGPGPAVASGAQARPEGVARAPGPTQHAQLGQPQHQPQAQQQFKAPPQKPPAVPSAAMNAPSQPGSGGMVVDQSMGGPAGGGQFQQHIHAHSQQHAVQQMHQAQQRGQHPPQQMGADQHSRGSSQEQQPGRPSQHHQQPGGGPPVAVDGSGTHRMMAPGGPPAPPSHAAAVQHPHHAQAQAQAQQQQPGGGPPVEFDHAINYVTTIKKRFASEPEIYKKFLEILHTYQKEQRGIKEVLDEVSLLFSEHPDLLTEFTYFLPDAVQAQAKAQLDQVAKESEMRKRAASSKQAIMQTARGMQRHAHGMPASVRGQSSMAGNAASTTSSGGFTQTTAPVPFGATQGRSEEREREICRAAAHGIVSFSPERPPRRGELTAAQAAVKNGRPKLIPVPPIQPSTAESAFFERAKLHLGRKELAPDKPPGSRRHTPYTEFLKCLHLYGAGILNKEELFLLLRGLFMQGHAPKSGANAGGGASNPTVASDAQELLREFEEIMVGRGPYADQENLLKDKSKYGAMSSRDFDASHSERPTPSYRTYPADYPHSLFFAHSGQTEADASVLNSTLICAQDPSNKKQIISSPEDYDAVRMRHNSYEEAMFRVEDEKFEVDMAIERNVMAMRQVEGIAEEVTQLRENEEKDGQPIGRATYTLRSRTLNGTQVNAIARLYGEKGDEVIQRLVRNPMAVLPIVYQRLREKEVEWRKAKADMSKRWKSTLEENYLGSLDAICFFYKKEIEKSFLPEQLVEECKDAEHFTDGSESYHPATKSVQPQYSLSNPDVALLLFQPHLKMRVRGTIAHKDAFQCIALQCHTASSEDHEQISRIWSEFMVPFFNYPVNWFLGEMRESLHTQSSVVKYSSGQLVKTAYGDAKIVSTSGDSRSSGGVTYKVLYPYGSGFVRSSAIVHALPSSDGTLFARTNGIMKRVDVGGNVSGDDKKLPDSQSLVFSTESGFVFLRLYSLLVSILSDARKAFNKKNGDDAMDVEKTDESKKRSYAGVIMCLKKLLDGEIDFQVYESYCREALKEKVYLLAAVPKLVKSCAEALLEVAQEDLLLPLFDRSQHKGQNLLKTRSLCLKVTEDAEYRIQYDTSKQAIYFSYLPASVPLLTCQDATNDGDAEMHMEDVDGDLQPPAKRSKFY